jgi:hypothetical protein
MRLSNMSLSYEAFGQTTWHCETREIIQASGSPLERPLQQSAGALTF